MIRFFDILISILILLILSPVLLLVSLLILLIDGNPIIFKQPRIGYKGEEFIIFKFRTMNNSNFNDDYSRLTFLGKILRKTSIDELPQFLNVIKNEMSIVGPRPLPHNVENKIKKSYQMKRRKVLPGITGLSQINYRGKNRSLTEKIRLDLQFIDNYCLYNYFKIIICTPVVLIFRFFKNKSSIIR